MTRSEPTPTTTDDSFDTGRYLYCVVADDPETALDVTSGSGVGGGDVSLVRADGLAAVVQPCDSLFDSNDAETVRRWLLSHQTVVDRAGEAFGTPLPFRFDTVIQGDDAAVRTWLSDHHRSLSDALDALAGRWEYRIEVSWDESQLADDLASTDDRLADLQRQCDAADEGRSFLLQKQYDRRLDSLTEAQQAETMADLRERLDPLVERLEDVDRQPTGGLSPSRATDDRLRRAVTVLVRSDQEEAVGDCLSDLASRPGVEVRFTGPWPPYSFAPSVESDS